MKARYAAVLVGLALGLMSGAAKAAYIITAEQVGTSVVFTGSGSLDLSGLKPAFSGNFGNGPLSDGIYITNYYGTSENYLTVGGGSDIDIYFNGSLNRPLAVETDASLHSYPTSVTGAFVGFDATLGRLNDSNGIIVPEGYVSGTELGMSTATYEDATFASLDLKQGRYIDSVGADAITLDVGTVPLPSSAPMFGAALLALGAAGYGLKRKRAAA